jgi:threonine synthase
MPDFYSTHHRAPIVNFETALLQGLAPDGGLYYPTTMPHFSAASLERLHTQRQRYPDLTQRDQNIAFLRDVAWETLDYWCDGFMRTEQVRHLAAGAQSFPIYLRPVGDFLVLELFHGPTMAFKDVAAAYLARLMNYALKKRGEKAILLVATSGDTGGAIAAGFSGMESIQVVILYPEGKVSHLQEAQLTRVADNVTPIAITADFDACQALVKHAFTNLTLPGVSLTSANSINVARLLPQMIYYAFLYFATGRDDLEVIVPSGNFGNLTAGLFAHAMGIPIAAFTAATNSNNVVSRYLETAAYQPEATHETFSTAMDVGNPSNFARVLEFYRHQHPDVVSNLRAHAVSDEETAATIKRVYERYNYLLCPHTAVGWHVAEQHARPTHQPVVVATASPLKFAAEIEARTGIPVDNRADLERLERLPVRKTVIPNEWSQLEGILRDLAG